MSSLYVRNRVRDWCENTPDLVLPFYPTVNNAVQPEDPMWFTVAFVNAGNATTTYCGNLEERGVFDFIALGVPGIGDTELLQAAEHDLRLLMERTDPAARLTLLRAGPPEDFLQAAGVPWYTVSMTVEYVYMQPAELPVP